MKNLMAVLLLWGVFAANAHSVEDTVRYQIGYPLHFFNDEAPEEITVIGARYYKQDAYLPFPDAEYRYINHAKVNVGHEQFSEEYLKERYASFFFRDTFNSWPEVYRNMVDQALEIIGPVREYPVIENYTGYWVYLEKYGEEYYLDQCWDFIPSFQIEEDRIHILSMDGPFPYMIRSAGRDEKGGIIINTQYGNSEKESGFVLECIDEARKVYRFDSAYVTPAVNSSDFKLIQYANRSGDLIAW